MDWLTSMPFLFGDPPDAAAPLSRYLPPLPHGPVRDFLSARISPGGWVLDPFGASPPLVSEAARAGYRVLVAANNPVARFLIEMSAAPPPLADFQAALAELAVSRKENERLEQHIQSLYLTECPGCHRRIPADAFIWEKKSGVLLGRILSCPHCGTSGEHPATPADAELAARWSHAESMHRARALERVAPRDDPDREYAAEAIGIYPPRALYALWTLINRLDQLRLPPDRRRALTALLLSACDAASGLWPHPTERPRPRQLSLPAQFRENNVWRALEQSAAAWVGSLPPVHVAAWPAVPPESGGICLFEGALRDLTPKLAGIPLAAVVSAIPRPNQAFWTLSALWSGWLWGRESTGAFKFVLRRRRYDWQWHAEALRAAFASLPESLPAGAPFFALLAEPEAPFISAALGAAQFAGYPLEGIAMRTASDPLQVVWKKAQKPEAATPRTPDARIAQAAIQHLLSARGEALTHTHLHLAGVAALAQTNALPAGSDSLNETGGAVLRALDSPAFVRHDARSGAESGLWDVPAGASSPFSDQVEVAVVRLLQQNPGAPAQQLIQALHRDFPGLLTPSAALVQAILESYAVETHGWRLREEDQPPARRAELESMRALVRSIGLRLGFTLADSAGGAVAWLDSGQVSALCHVSASALLGKLIDVPSALVVLVIPGGRAGLIAYKRKRDPVLREKTKTWHFLKYRHLRQIAELPLLTRETWPELLRSDPIEQQGGQMMLF